MTSDIYYQLREGMDQIGTGFNATESGVEMRILKKIFTEEEARMYLACTARLESIDVIAGRVYLEPDQIAPLLQRMADKGLLFSSPSKAIVDISTHYAAASWLPGIMEFQTHTMDTELAQLITQYFRGEFKKKGSFLRPIPVNQEIAITRPVAPYDDVREIIKNKDRILVVPCACVNIAEHLGIEIDQPRDICFMFGFYADFHADKGLGRWVSQEEALGILQQCEEAGLVHQISDTPTVDAICNCGKFCGSLKSLNTHPRPAELCASNYYAQVDSSLCSGCEMCVPRCHMKAVTVGLVAGIARNRCIGCGLCMSVCPTGALSLYLKPEGECHILPETNPFWRSSQEFARDME